MSFEITASDLPAFTLGCAILACGGGGNPYYGQLVARDLLAKCGPVKVVDVEDMEADTVAVVSAFMGAPLVFMEKTPDLIGPLSGFEAVKAMSKVPIGAFVAAEVGGGQGILPIILAARTGVPVVNGDGMGRAFPEMQMTTFLIYGLSPGFPVALSDDHGLLWRLRPLPFLKTKLGGTTRGGSVVGVALERLFRRYCAYKGGKISVTATIDQRSLERTVVRGSFRLALDLGRGVESARAKGDDPVAAILRIAKGRVLFQGKIVDVERQFRGGYDWGTVKIEGMDADRGRRAEMSFKNEYIIFRADDEVVLTVPDLITTVETQTGVPITTDAARQGLRVSVVGMQSSPLMRTPEALRVVGPNAFGYDLPFTPLIKETVTV